MKNHVLLLMLLLATAILFATKPKTGVHSVSEFEKLYQSKEFPFNKISDTTFQRLKSGIAFDDKGQFRGFLFIGGLRKELTYEEYIKFNELISGFQQDTSEEDKKEYERRRNLK